MTDNSIIRRNRLEQGRHDPTKIKLLQDRLDEKGKARLAQLLLEIDENDKEILLGVESDIVSLHNKLMWSLN